MNMDASPGQEEKRNILKARAKALAQPFEGSKTSQATLQVVEFRLAHERYAVETAFVKSIHALTEITPVPCTPPFVLGIINVRGQIVTVIDLKKFFDLPDNGITSLNKVIIIHAADVEVGVLADEVFGGRQLEENELQGSLPTLTGIGAEYLRGVTGDRLVVLDVETILSGSQIIVDEKVEG